MISHATKGAWAVGRIVGAACLALTLASCAAVRSWDLMDTRGDFQDNQRQYTQYVRWGAFEQARQFVAKDAIERWDASRPLLSDVRFTEYTTQSNEFDIEKMTATVRVTYNGYKVNSLVERTVEEKQEWSRDPVTGQWQVRPDLTVLSAGMAGTRP
ncbi:MAG TPA: hypothetical protein VK714_19315 [Myxococcota bacterium]|nr:hypothetical protein [Myxococcota bacterium]